MDYSRYASNGKFYGGKTRKKGILIDGEDYIVKYAEESTVSHISEYIASHLFAHAGIKVRQTMLGTCDKEQVVVIKDFLKRGECFVSFQELLERAFDITGQEYPYSYDGIEKTLQVLLRDDNADRVLEWFWDMYIVDAWLGMPLRTADNWGFVKKEGKYHIAPVYGNSSALFPEYSTDDELNKVLKSQDEMNRCIYGKKSSYYDLINSLGNESCNQALMRIYEKIDMQWVKHFIDGIDELSPVRKEFYLKILQERYFKMLEEPYRRLSNVMNIRRLMSMN